MEDTLKRVILLACGSFNPITDQHLRLFEVARDALHKTGRYRVIGGVVSPVNDAYAKKDLASANHRCDMIKLAIKSSNWIRLDTWEADQNEWTESLYVLRHQKEIASATYAGKSQTDSPNPSAKRRRLNNANNRVNSDGASDQNNGDIEVKLLCGGDVLESFSVPNLWKQEHMEEIVSKFGMVVCTRNGSNIEKFIYESDLLTKYKNNIHVVTEWITNDVSATKIRRAVRRGESVKYLLQDSVIEYIKKNGLYGAVDDNKLMNNFTLSPTDPRPPPGQTQSGKKAENMTQERPMAAADSYESRNYKGRDACNNLILDLHQAQCCKAFLRSQSLDNEAQCCQLIPYQAQSAKQKHYPRDTNAVGQEKLRYNKREISSDSIQSTASGDGKPEKGRREDGRIRGKGGGRGGEDFEKEDVRKSKRSTRAMKREDSLNLLISPDNEKSNAKKSQRNVGYGARMDSLDSLGSGSGQSGSSHCESAPPSPTQPKKSINCMVADIVGLVRRIKRLRFSSNETHV